jgi:hypothetical protein
MTHFPMCLTAWAHLINELGFRPWSSKANPKSATGCFGAELCLAVMAQIKAGRLLL